MPTVELKIAINELGQIQLTGPIDNEMVCYYLLEKGRQAIAMHHDKAVQRLVQPATALPRPSRD
jgi:hypothetical protein